MSSAVAAGRTEEHGVEGSHVDAFCHSHNNALQFMSQRVGQTTNRERQTMSAPVKIILSAALTLKRASYLIHLYAYLPQQERIPTNSSVP